MAQLMEDEDNDDAFYKQQFGENVFESSESEFHSSDEGKTRMLPQLFINPAGFDLIGCASRVLG